MALRKSQSIYIFPMALEELAETGDFPYVNISLVEASLNSAIDDRVSFDSLSFFMPEGVTNSDTIDYGASDLGIGKSILDRVRSGGTLSDISNSDMVEVGKRSLVSLTGAIAPGIGSTIEFATRTISNPNSVSTFAGVGLRTFSLSFKLAPESKKESDRIRDIENKLRYYMYPEKDDSGFLGTLKYPPLFRVKFMVGSKENKYMPFYHDAYLTSLSVQYNGDGNTYHREGAPISVTIAMEFKESVALTRNDIYKKNSFDYNYNQRDQVNGVNNILGTDEFSGIINRITEGED